MSERCECGLLVLDTEPEDYGRAVALVTAYCFGELMLFDGLLTEAVKVNATGVMSALVEGASVALGLAAEAQDQPLSAVLRDWCAGAAHVAEGMP
jgi:hypothetical protein